MFTWPKLQGVDFLLVLVVQRNNDGKDWNPKLSIFENTGFKWDRESSLKIQTSFFWRQRWEIIFVLLNMDHKTLVIQFSFISHDMCKKDIIETQKTQNIKASLNYYIK